MRPHAALRSRGGGAGGSAEADAARSAFIEGFYAKLEQAATRGTVEPSRDKRPPAKAKERRFSRMLFEAAARYTQGELVFALLELLLAQVPFARPKPPLIAQPLHQMHPHSGLEHTILLAVSHPACKRREEVARARVPGAAAEDFGHVAELPRCRGGPVHCNFQRRKRRIVSAVEASRRALLGSCGRDRGNELPYGECRELADGARATVSDLRRILNNPAPASRRHWLTVAGFFSLLFSMFVPGGVGPGAGTGWTV